MDAHRRYCIIVLLLLSFSVSGQLMIPGVIASSIPQEDSTILAEVWYLFENNTADSSGNNRPFTTAPDSYNGSIYMQGAYSGEYESTTESTVGSFTWDQEPMTIVVNLYKPSAETSTGRHYIMRRGNATDGWTLELDGNNLDIELHKYNSGVEVEYRTGNGDFTEDQWVQVMVIIDGSDVTFYLDGVDETSGSVGTETATMYTGGNVTMGFALDANIDAVAIYKLAPTTLQRDWIIANPTDVLKEGPEGRVWGREAIVIWSQDLDDFGSTVPKNNLNTTDRDIIYSSADGSDGWGFDGIFNVNLVISDSDTMLQYEMLADGDGPDYGSSTYKVLRGVTSETGDSLYNYTELWGSFEYQVSSDFYEERGGKALGGFTVGQDGKEHTGGAGPPYDGINLRASWNGEPDGEAVWRWYYYYQNQPTAFGVNSSNFEIPWGSSNYAYLNRDTDKHTFTWRQVMVTAGDSTQQYIQSFIDGVLAHNLDSLLMRENDSLHFDFMFSGLFRGAGAPPSFDTHINYDKLRIFYYEDGPNTLTDQERATADQTWIFPGMEGY